MQISDDNATYSFTEQNKTIKADVTDALLFIFAHAKPILRFAERKSEVNQTYIQIKSGLTHLPPPKSEFYILAYKYSD